MTGISEIAPRLGQLIRMLSSDQDGEVINAARAIGKTLAGAHLDIHDLAQLVENAPSPYVYRPTTSAYRPAHRPTTPSEPVRESPKPKTPNPWPTYSLLRQSHVIAWVHAVENGSHSIDKNTRPDWHALRRKIVCRPHEILTRKEINLFNRLVRSTWEKGVRV